MPEKVIKIIVATGCQGEIGQDGKLPWPRISSDMKNFCKTTSCTDDPEKYNAVIMGRRTFESLGGALMNRLNLVVTSSFQDLNAKYTSKGNLKFFETPADALHFAENDEKVESVFIIGGEKIYEYFFPMADYVYNTHIMQQFPDADRFFNFDYRKFTCMTNGEKMQEENGVKFLFSLYRRSVPHAEFELVENTDKKYLKLVKKVLAKGVKKNDRTGVGTTSIFGSQIVYDFKLGFPLLTTKRVYFKGIVAELLWFLKGDTNIKYLNDNSVKIWDDWADENGDLGPIYGKQWVNWGGEINQIADVIDLLKKDPDSRRILVSAYNVGELDKMALQPCHFAFQFYTRPIEETEKQWKHWRGLWDVHAEKPERFIDIIFHMRSNDVFLGHPFNIASYALLLQMVAQCVNMVPGKVIFNGGDVHIYNNHLEQADEILNRKTDRYTPPWVKLNPEIKDIFEFGLKDIELMDYQSYPSISAKIAV